jgi:hypothetical protein
VCERFDFVKTGAAGKGRRKKFKNDAKILRVSRFTYS